MNGSVRAISTDQLPPKALVCFAEHYSDLGGEIRECHLLGGHGVNSTNYRVTSGDRPFHLKIIQDADEDLLGLRLRIWREASLAGVNVVPVLSGDDGELYHGLPDGSFLIVFEYCEGEVFKFAGDIMHVAREFARINGFLREKQEYIERSPKYRPISLEEVESIRSKLSGRTEFEVLVEGYLNEAAERHLTICKELMSACGRPRIQHIDYIPPNVIIDPEGSVKILDFDALTTAFPFQSVAFGAHRFSKGAREFHNFLNEYREVDSDLNGCEQKVIFSLARYEVMARVSFLLRGHYFENNHDWDRSMAQHMKSLEELDQLEHEL